MVDNDEEELVASVEQLQRSVFEWVKDDTGAEAKLHQTITAEEVARVHGIPQKELLRYIRKEIEEADACFSLPFTLMLVFSYAIMAIAHDDAITIRAVEDSLKEDIHANANFAMTGPMGHKGIDDVNSFADFWSWYRIGLLPLIFQQTATFHEGWEESTQAATFANLSIPTIPPNERGFWLNYNRIVGGIRISQERMEEEATCPTVSELLPLYHSKCVGGLDYNLNPELGLPAEKAQVTVNPTRVEWVYSDTDLVDMQEAAKKLEASQWLDRLTKKIEIAIPSYNAEFGLHTLTRVNFYFSRGGHIWKKILPMSQYADWHDRWYYGLYDAIWVACIFYIFVIEVIQILGVIRRAGVGAIFSEYIHLWNFIDWMSVLGGVAILVIFFVSVTMRNEMNKELESIGEVGCCGALYKSKVKDYTEQLQNNVNFINHLRNIVALYPLVIIIRLFKAFSAQPKLAMVTETLRSALPELFHFFIVFGSVFITFTICSIVLFGRELSSFTTFPRATIACFRIMMGDIEYEELSQVGRAETSIWLWLYIVIVVLLMLNMIIAIIMDHYEEVKSNSGNAETLFEEAYQIWHRWKGKRAGTYVPLERVLEALLDEQRQNKEKVSRMVGSKKKNRFFRGFTGGLKEKEPDEDLFETEADGELQRGSTGNLELGGITTADDLHGIVNRHLGRLKFTMSETQALEVVQGAVEDYYELNKKSAEIDEILQLTQKTNFRVKKLVRGAKKASGERDTAPVQEFVWFGKDVNSYLEALMQERAENHARLEALTREKHELETRLISLGGGFVKSETLSVSKRADILRTAHRMTQRHTQT